MAVLDSAGQNSWREQAMEIRVNLWKPMYKLHLSQFYPLWMQGSSKARSSVRKS